MAAQSRYDKNGRQLPDTGRGCGCRLCEDAGAPRYERRGNITRAGGSWSAVRRTLLRMVHSVAPPRGTQTA